MEQTWFNGKACLCSNSLLLYRALMMHTAPSIIKVLVEGGALVDLPFTPDTIPPANNTQSITARPQKKQSRRELEEEKEREVERRVAYFPPLAIAFYYDQLGFVQYLLEKGASIFVRCFFKITAKVSVDPSISALLSIDPALAEEFQQLLSGKCFFPLSDPLLRIGPRSSSQGEG